MSMLSKQSSEILAGRYETKVTETLTRKDNPHWCAKHGGQAYNKHQRQIALCRMKHYGESCSNRCPRTAAKAAQYNIRQNKRENIHVEQKKRQ